MQAGRFRVEHSGFTLRRFLKGPMDSSKELDSGGSKQQILQNSQPVMES